MAASNPAHFLPCDDFQKFQDSLKKLRLIDDRIIHALNTTLPTQSFRSNVDAPSVCKRFYDELQLSYDQRASSIRHCLTTVNNEVEILRHKKMEAPDDLEIIKNLRKEQTKIQ
ncbi:hypothetical protein RRG08_008863 [Elysia crispata]|uniref:Protein MIX23 n=1 Tax=Elysia crispata TaxID=231223 RepID=A0AAE0ZWK2_9GAST|nr:hypothetical protein RRG08_008863 [Elysia crispata]